MRLRKVPYAAELIEQHSDIVYTSPADRKANWGSIFPHFNPIEVEVGCGKGQFIIEMAKKHPDVNFIGIEKYDSVIIRGLEKLIESPVGNVKFIQKDASEIESFFDFNEVQQLYLNFSDPWPKKRQAKRRLTHPRFLEKYKYILKSGASIKFKTDNFELFEYSKTEFGLDPDYSIQETCLDYHEVSGNISTEFELRFVEMGKPIYYLHVIFTRRTDNEGTLS